MTAEHAHGIDTGGEVAAEILSRFQQKRRSRLIVEIDLDPMPGWGDNAADHRALVQRQLDDAVKHYHPTVTIADDNVLADAVLAEARRLCCGNNPSAHHAASAKHSERMAFAGDLARAVRGL